MIKRRKINRIESDLKVYSSICAGDGDIVRQSYNAASGETYPDRRLIPLTLTPVAGYTNPDTGMSVTNALPELTDGHWYRLDNSTTGGLNADSEITNGMTIKDAGGKSIARFDINTTIGSAKYGEIKIYENVSAGNPVTYVFKALLATGKPKVIVARYRCVTESVEVMPELYFDNDTQGLYNPVDGARYFTIHPRVSPSGLKATFAWETLHSAKWGALGSTLYDWALTRDGDGVRIDRSVMQDVIKLKCVATVEVGGAYVQVEGIVTHTRRMPKIEYEMIHVGDLNEGDKEINPYALVKVGKKILTDLSELRTDWYGSGSTAIGSGINPKLKVSQLGASMDLGLDVKDRGGWKHLVTADGKPIVTADGKSIICR